MKVVKFEGSGTVTVLREFVRCSAAARKAAELTVCAPAGIPPSKSGKPTSTTVAQPTTHTAIVPLALLFFCAILRRTTRILLVVRSARDWCLPERDHARFAFILTVIPSLHSSCTEGAFSCHSCAVAHREGHGMPNEVRHGLLPVTPPLPLPS